MSGESTDSESVPSDNNKRCRSLLRQVRARFGSRQQIGTIGESSAVLLIRQKRRSFDNIDIQKVQLKCHIKKAPTPKTPISFSHRLSLLNQVKSHITGTWKYHRTVPSTWNNDDDDIDFLSIPSVISNSETKTSSTNGENQNTMNYEIEPPSPDSPVFEDVDETAMLLDGSFHITSDDEGQTNELSRTLNSSRTGLNKFKEQFTQRARTVMTKAPSLTSVISTPPQSPGGPDQAYWTEIFIERGKDLCAKDIRGTSDPYVKVMYGTEEKYTTNTVMKDLNPVWNEKFSIFTDDLNIPLYFNIFDHDRIGRDESMGSARVELWKLPFERLYTATLDLEHEQRNDGKNGMLKISITITPKPAEFREAVLRSLAKQAQTRGGRPGTHNGVIVPRRTIDVFIIEGRNLVSTGVNKICSPYIRLKYGTNKKYRTQTIKLTQNPKWHQSFMYDTTSSELLPLELSVYDDTSSSGDFLGRATCNLAHLDEERTHRISVDLEDGTGVIELFITITTTTALQEATNDGDSSVNTALDIIPSRLTEAEMKHYNFLSTFRSLGDMHDVGKVEIKIYQARDLSAKDIIGKSDPFCIIELDSNRLRTHTIYKTLNPIWNKSFIIPVQDIHSIMEIIVYDEDTNKNTEFIGKVTIPLLAIKNGEKKWITLKDRKCLVPVKGAIEIEATFVYTNLKAVARTFNPRQTAYYQIDEKFSVGAIKQHVARIRNMLKSVFNVMKFIDYCFHWESPFLSFAAFMASLIIVWNFELYMLPCTLLLLLIRNAVIEHRRGRLGKPFTSLGDETVANVVQTTPVDEEILEVDAPTKEQKKSFIGVIHGITDTVVEIQGYIDGFASSLERIKNLFNFTVPWLSVLLILILFVGAFVLYYIPLRYLILAFVINKFTKRFRKPKDFIDNNELADFMSRLPSDPELMQYRELKVLSRLPTPKKNPKKFVNSK